MNISRDLFLLSAVAFQEGQYEKAGTLFQACLSSADVEEFLNKVDSLDNEQLEVESSNKKKLSDISKIISNSIKSSVLASESSDDLDDDAEEEDEDDTSENEDDTMESSEDDTNLDEDIESDDVDGDVAGEKIIPSALSSVHSAIRVKQ